MIRALRFLCFALAASAGLPDAVSALPMAPEACESAKAEQVGLEGSGVSADMARGADWAKANLSADRMSRVARWIELQEQILFRCPRPKPVEAAVTPPAGTSPSSVSGSPNVKKVVKPAPKPSAPPAKPAAEVGDAGDTAPKPEKTRKKQALDDAYRPPAPFSGDLQHAAPGLSVPTGGAGLAP